MPVPSSKAGLYQIKMELTKFYTSYQLLSATYLIKQSCNIESYLSIFIYHIGGKPYIDLSQFQAIYIAQIVDYSVLLY